MIRSIKLNLANILVMIGIVMNVAAAIIATIVVNDNSVLIFDMEKGVSNYEREIDNMWGDLRFKEQSINTLILLKKLDSGTNQMADDTLKYAQNVVRGQASLATTNFSIDELIEHIKSIRITTVNRIDDIFYEKIKLTAQVNDLKRKDSLYVNISVFIQILGLVLILSKEIFKR